MLYFFSSVADLNFEIFIIILWTESLLYLWNQSCHNCKIKSENWNFSSVLVNPSVFTSLLRRPVKPNLPILWEYLSIIFQKQLCAWSFMLMSWKLSAHLSRTHKCRKSVFDFILSIREDKYEELQTFVFSLATLSCRECEENITSNWHFWFCTYQFTVCTAALLITSDSFEHDSFC